MLLPNEGSSLHFHTQHSTIGLGFTIEFMSVKMSWQSTTIIGVESIIFLLCQGTMFSPRWC